MKPDFPEKTASPQSPQPSPKTHGRTKAIVVGIDFHDALFEDRLSEAVELVKSAGAVVAATISGKRAKPDAGTFAGSGKVEEIAACVAEQDANLVVFNHQLSPIQIRNIEKIVGVRVIDRTDLQAVTIYNAAVFDKKGGAGLHALQEKLIVEMDAFCNSLRH